MLTRGKEKDYINAVLAKFGLECITRTSDYTYNYKIVKQGEHWYASDETLIYKNQQEVMAFCQGLRCANGEYNLIEKV